jgi:hypothetical protein
MARDRAKSTKSMHFLALSWEILEKAWAKRLLILFLNTALPSFLEAITHKRKYPSWLSLPTK